jgi:competence protein ComEA
MITKFSKKITIIVFFTLSYPAFAVDINTATAQELATELFGIGPVKAQRIVEYREKIGGFSSIEQLIEVKGIGPKTLIRNRNKLELSTLQNKPLSYPPHPSPNNGVNLKDNRGVSTLNNSNDLKISENSAIDANLDISPEIEKPTKKIPNWLWDTLIIISLFVTSLVIFMVAWLKGAKFDKPVPRKHLVSTTFVCASCGKESGFQNVRYEGHFNNQYIDGKLPPGWSCIKNWLGKPCDYCFDCSQKVHPDNYWKGEKLT